MIAKKKRTTHEVNAGSMADIAFLLLIFFLVTTTMEIDEGLARLMPLKIEHPVPPPPVIDRNVLEISLNSKDELFVEGSILSKDELEEQVRLFYTANIFKETDETMPLFEYITAMQCSAEIDKLNLLMKESPDNLIYKEQMNKWETRLSICKEMPKQTYQEMNRAAVVQIENQANTSYKTYIFVLNTIKQVVNELRVAKCKEVWNKDYFALNEGNEKDAAILSKLSIMIPERIIEKPIVR